MPPLAWESSATKVYKPVKIWPAHSARLAQYSADILLIGMLLFLSATWGMNRLDNWQGPAGSLSNDLFIPAIMMNAGRGFVSADPQAVPGLRTFLDFQCPEFNLENIPPELDTFPADPYQSFHRYLIYSVAITWKVFGVTWDAIKVLLVIFLCATVLLVFLISRVAMHPILAFLATLGFLYAPPLLMTLHILRDFAKAPFILALLWLLAMIVRYRLSGRNYLIITAVAGLVLGVGMGFRREVIIFIPVSLFIVNVAFLKMSFKKSLAYRLGGAVLLCAFFTASAWPIHRSLAAHGYVAAHDTIMGFSSDSDQEIGLLTLSSYEKHYLYNDLYATLKAHDAAMRNISRTDAYSPYDDLEIKRDYVNTLFKTFPADILTRAYASVLRLATGVFPTQNVFFRGVETFGMWFMIGALLLCAAKSPWRAWLLLLLICWFCGYTSLQFGLRHVFHMTFVPYWFAGFFIQFVGRTVSDLYREGCPQLSPILRRFCVTALWACITVLAFAGPRVAAGYLQQEHINQIANAYANAESVPVSYQVTEWEGKQVLSPDLSSECRPCNPQFSIDTLRHRVLVARFSGLTGPIHLFLLYEWEELPWDFSGRVSLDWASQDEPVDVDLVIPVHEATACGATSAFAGLLVEEHLLPHFRGFHLLQDLSQAPLLVAMAIPVERHRLISKQGITFPWHGHPWHAVFRPYFLFGLTDPHEEISAIKGHLNAGEVEPALEKVRGLLAKRPGSIQVTFLLCEVLANMEKFPETYELVADLIQRHPDNFMLFSRLSRFLQDHPAMATGPLSWSHLLEAFSDNCLLKEYGERSTLSTKHQNPDAIP